MPSELRSPSESLLALSGAVAAPAIAPGRVESGPADSEYTLTRRAWLTAIASLLDYTARLAVGVMVTPVVVGYLGKSLFGAWEILLRLVGHMSLADGRPMDALRLVLSTRHATVNDDTNRRTLGMAVGVWMLFLPVLCLAGAAIVWIAPVLAGAPPELVPAVRVTAALLVLNTLLTMLVALPEAVLFGVNQGYRRMGLVAAAHFLGAMLTVAVLRAGLGLPGLAVAQVAITLLTAAMFLVLARRYVAWFGIAKPSARELRWFARLSGWSLAADSLARLLLASDVILLGLLASTSAVTSYVLTGYAAQSIVGVLSLGLGAIVPGLASVVGRGENARAAALRAEMLSIGWLVSTVVGSTILMWNRGFLELWVGSGHYAGFWANVLLVLVMVQTVFIRTDAYVINAMLRLRARVLISVPAAALTCGLAVVTVPRFGIAGICVSVLGGRMVQSIAYPIVVRSTLGGSQSSDGVPRAVLVMLLLFLLSAWLGQRLGAGSWTAWLFGVAVTSGAFSAVAFATGLDARRRHLLLQRVRSVPLPIRW